MKTILIITLGTRDVQLKNNLEKTERELLEDLFTSESDKLLVIKNPREQGAKIDREFDKFFNYLSFPIIEPALLHILSGNKSIDKLFIFSTNQPNAESRYKNRDTLFFAKIIEKTLKKSYGNKIKKISNIKLSGNLTYYDEMYDKISELTKDGLFNFNKDEYKVYLLAQGGIDAINTALLLKSIELFPNLTQLHKPENQDFVEILSFPDKFRFNFNKQLLLNSVKNFNYSIILENFSQINETITELCNYSHSRLMLDYQGAFASCEKLIKSSNLDKNYITNVLQSEISLLSDITWQKQKDLYLSAKIKFHQRYYGDFLMRIFTLSENLLKPHIKKLGFDITYDESTNPRHKKWVDSFEKIDKKENNKISESLKNNKLKKGGLKYDSPNKYAFYGIIEYYSEKNNDFKPILELCKIIYTLADLRNTVAHRLDSVTVDMIETELRNKNNSNINTFIEKMDNYFGLNGKDDFGIYDQINKKIISLL